MKYTIRQNSKYCKFEAVDENNLLIGVVNYEIKDNSILSITHTAVEPECEGQGVAGALIKEVLLFAKKSNFKVLALCSYAQNYIDKHPEFQSLEEH